ncbi:hypothetical protein DFQ27_007320 [Actinomortierella ambigua]|uniref:AMP-dependent synthetase/ligase domain-containing protein n=1 Tax=Actinomortierella ambigua TaxID=1343610 RepID=A0A9P6QJQ7_9FUNG|nr:hypothetical protein DFQ27_007320 [Actinomortierella ambigua]
MTASMIDYTKQGIEMPGTRSHGQTGLKVSPDKDCLGVRQYDPATGAFGDYVWQSYTTVSQRRFNFGSGLVEIHHQLFPELDEGARKQWTVAIWGPNRPEWTIAGLACDAYNLISVGLFDALEIEAIVYSIGHSEAPIMVACVDHLVPLIKNADRMPKLKVIISMDRLGNSNKTPGDHAKGNLDACDILYAWAEEKGIRLLDFDQVEQLGAHSRREHTPPKPEDLFVISYTSGTTGLPKGAMITHANYATFLATCERCYPIFKEDITISYLPLGHIFGRVMETIAFSAGARFGYVPRLLNRIYARVKAETIDVSDETGVQARMAFEAKMANYMAGKGVHHPEWDRVVFHKVRQILGGNYFDTCLPASAPVSSEILAFCRVAFSCDIVEVYAQTESTGVATVTNVGCEIKLIDAPELNYLTTDKPYPRGEICIRGPPVIKGYYKNEEKTRETFDDQGFLHSGDIAVLYPNGTFKIIDRAKNIFKGEYVAAENIENKLLARVPFIQQLFVHGDSHQSCLVAIMVPEPEAFLSMAQKILTLNLSTEDPDVFRDAIMIEPTPFTVENGRLTPTFKIKRHPVVQEYREQLTAMYDEIHQRMSRL